MTVMIKKTKSATTTTGTITAIMSLDSLSDDGLT